MMQNKNNKSTWFDEVTEECKGYPVPFDETKTGPGNCIDLGSNVGGFVEAWKDHIDFFYCVDAGSDNIKEFQSHHQSLIDDCRVHLEHAACHHTTGEEVRLRRFVSSELPEGDNSGSNATVSFQYKDGTGWSDDPKEFEVVETLSFEDILEDALEFFDADEIDLLKVDIEGAESDFLLGKDLSKIRFIAGEFHNFLDLIPSDSNPLINKRWELIQHIRKTHKMVWGIETLQGGNPLNYGSPIEESEVGQCHFTPLFARNDYGLQEQEL